jgi:hypothetical protein
LVGYRRRNGLFVTGIVLTSSGAASLLATFILAEAASSCNADIRSKYGGYSVPEAALSEVDHCHTYSTAAAVALILSVPLLATGLPLMIVGAKKRPVYAPSASLTPWLARQSGGLDLRVRF